MIEQLHAIRFPNESVAYRRSRDELLKAEMTLRSEIERLAELRRALPLGGEVLQDYPFAAENEKTVRLSELFVRDGLVVYSFMFGPRMSEPCPMCTSILDALNGEVPHIRQRTNIAVVAACPIDRILSFARTRDWDNLPLLSSYETSFNRDYHAETPDGEQLPALNVFVRRDGRSHHFYNAELLYAPLEPDQSPRHVDSIWPLWNVLDLTPEGRGKDWMPSLYY
jgi:predicted dithiol-disulfide oxidoreductase (DUF899 family)